MGEQFRPRPWVIRPSGPYDADGIYVNDHDVVVTVNALAAENARLREVLGNLVETSNRMCVTSRLGTKEWNAAMTEAESLLKGSKP